MENSSNKDEFIRTTYDAQKLTAKYYTQDGRIYEKIGGSLAWRLNNPGAIRFNRALNGVIGEAVTQNNGSFSIFKDINSGKEAIKSILRGPSYGSLNIEQALAKYAPQHDRNNPVAYADFVVKQSGISRTQPLSELNNDEMESVVTAIMSKEGFYSSKAQGKEGWIENLSVVVSNQGTPLAEEKIIIQVNNKKYERQTEKNGVISFDAFGNLIGKTISIFLKNSIDEFEKIFQHTVDDTPKNIQLEKKFISYKGITRPHEPKNSEDNQPRKSLSYVVKPGDTLEKIGNIFKTSVDSLVESNNIKDKNRILPGQILVIYGKGNSASEISAESYATETYIVKHGDTLAEIALKKGTTVSAIVADNNIQNANMIDVGQALKIKPSSIKNANNTSPASVNKPVAPAKLEPVPINLNSDKQNPALTIPPNDTRVPWMRIAIRELEQWKGKKEGAITDNYHKLAGGTLGSIVGNGNPWCASFVNYCLQESGFTPSRQSARVRSFKEETDRFVKIDRPVYGCLALYLKANLTGHVGFLYGFENDRLILLGGNQSDQIRFSSFSANLNFIYVLPNTYYNGRYTLDASQPLLNEFVVNDLNQHFGQNLTETGTTR